MINRCSKGIHWTQGTSLRYLKARGGRDNIMAYVVTGKSPKELEEVGEATLKYQMGFISFERMLEMKATPKSLGQK